jgi:hypothetical protein
MSKYYLSVCAIFRNEQHSILEWIKHYLIRGVDHFYLFDDESNDKSLEKIKPYVESGIITLFTEYNWGRYLGRQRAIYTQFFLPIVNRKETKWLLVVDMDEYVWSETHPKITDFLNLFNDLAQIQVRDTLFGSNGYIEQPESLIHYFTKRTAEIPTLDGCTKYFVNSDYNFTSLNIHHATFEDVSLEKTVFKIFFNPYLILNHYKFQSYDFWKNVKCTRGDGDHYLVRKPEEFEILDEKLNEVEDRRLSEQTTILEKEYKSFLL